MGVKAATNIEILNVNEQEIPLIDAYKSWKSNKGKTADERIDALEGMIKGLVRKIVSLEEELGRVRR